MAIATPAGFTTIVTPLPIIRDNFCALTNSGGQHVCTQCKYIRRGTASNMACAPIFTRFVLFFI